MTIHMPIAGARLAGRAALAAAALAAAACTAHPGAALHEAAPTLDARAHVPADTVRTAFEARWDAVSAAWDGAARQLCEAPPRVLYAHAPVLWFRPRPAADIEGAGRYACPLYRTAERRGVLATTGHSTNFVAMVRLPSGAPAAHWVMRGAALLAQLSD